MILKLITFICSMAVMILELAGVRVITPFLGAGFIVWTCTIGIIMASLSLGYYMGGKLSDKNPNEIKLSSFITGASLYIFLIAVFGFKFLEEITSGSITNSYYISIITGLVIFAIPSVLLGMVSPYVIKIALLGNESENSGTLIGKFYAISTFGSIIGTFLTGFYLIIFFGIDTILFILADILTFSSSILIVNNLRDKRNIILFIFQILILLISFFFIYSYKINNKQIFKNSIYSKTTAYQYIYIKIIPEYSQNDNFLCLTTLKGGCHSQKYENDKSHKVFGYTLFFEKLYNLKSKRNNILILGGAGNTLASRIIYLANKEHTENISIDTVELDKDISKIAKKYFDVPNDNRLKFFYEDARTFINRESKSPTKLYDIIYLDVYKDNIIPNNMITYECYDRLKKLMNKDSMLCLNVYVDKKAGNGLEYLNQIYTQVKSVFPYIKCYSLHKIEDEDIFSIVITAYKDTTDENIQEMINSLQGYEYTDVKSNNVIFTDKYSPLERFEIYRS